MRHKDGNRHVLEHVPACAAKHELTQPCVPVAAYDQEVGRHVPRAGQQGFTDVHVRLDLVGSFAPHPMASLFGKLDCWQQEVPDPAFVVAVHQYGLVHVAGSQCGAQGSLGSTSPQVLTFSPVAVLICG